MKRAISLILALIMCLTLCACGGEQSADNGENSTPTANNGQPTQPVIPPEAYVGSEGLEFTSNGDGTCYVSDIGSCTDTDVVIPAASQNEWVTSIGEWAFSYCTSLESVTIPDSVTRIGDYAFCGCESLKSVTIPDSVTSIGKEAFHYCESLTSVTIGNGITSIGYGAFFGCKSLEYNVYDNAKYLGNSENPYLVLITCTSEDITSCEIYEDARVVYNYAFSYCTSLESITIPDSVTSIGEDAFDYCESLNAVYITDITAWCGIAFGSSDSNPLSYAKNLYLNEELVTNLIIPENITSIGDRAFRGCTSLESITIPDSVTSIGDGAFSGCTSLESITIPDSVTSIGGGAFSGCSLEYNVYDYANYLGNSENPYLVLIGCGMFSTSCEIHEDAKVIANSAFSDCAGLESITIPDGVTSIGNFTFMLCGLKSVTIPDSVTSIGYYAFYACTSLESITIPDSVTSIGDCTFHDCKSLTSVTIGNGVTSIGEEAFWDCKSLESVTIGDGVTSIGYGAFYGCDSLESITIPDSVTSIGEEAFHYCKSLTSVTIGNGVTSIGRYAFSSCKSLTSIHYAGTVEQWKALSKGNNWNSYAGDYTVYCTDGEI